MSRHVLPLFLLLTATQAQEIPVTRTWGDLRAAPALRRRLVLLLLGVRDSQRARQRDGQCARQSRRRRDGGRRARRRRERVRGARGKESERCARRSVRSARGGA